MTTSNRFGFPPGDDDDEDFKSEEEIRAERIKLAKDTLLALNGSIQPAYKKDATIFWKTNHFNDVIEDVVGYKFANDILILALKEAQFQNELIIGIGLVWYVKIV